MTDVGRPTDLTDEVRLKIEQAAGFGASIEEIAMFSGVHRSTMYRWMKENPELKDRIEELQERPVLLARQTVVKSLATEPEMALKYLERKRKHEFSTKVEQDLTGSFTTFEIVRGESPPPQHEETDRPIPLATSAVA